MRTAEDVGASRLGELALVDGASRIAAMNTVFYDALFDENAASHLAFGNAFPDGVTEQADRERVNTSQTHIDFMIGSPDSIITGIHTDSTRVPVLVAGNWAV